MISLLFYEYGFLIKRGGTPAVHTNICIMYINCFDIFIKIIKTNSYSNSLFYIKKTTFT